MRLHVRNVREGLHPSEVIVAVDTRDGEEVMTIDKRSMRSDTVEIGYPIDQHDGMLLVELPRETMTGTWRVWVGKDSVTDDARERAVA